MEKYNSLLEVRIHLNRLRSNYRYLQSKTQAKIIPILKADAYGHGLLVIAQTLVEEGVKNIAVGSVNESVYLRKNLSWSGRIYSLFGPVLVEDYERLSIYDITPFIGSFEQLEKLVATAKTAQKKIDIALKFDTGMHRLGFQYTDIAKLLAYYEQEKNFIHVLECSSHLACADEDVNVTENQYELFEKIIAEFHAKGFEIKSQIDNTTGFLQNPTKKFHAARIGLGLYGYDLNIPSTAGELLPVMEVSSHVIQLQKVQKGGKISYGHTFTAEKDMVLAAVAFGYADGGTKLVAPDTEVLIKGRRAKVCGRVCMQMCLVDVTDIIQTEHINVGEPVIILGQQETQSITLDELTKKWNRGYYEILCAVGKNNRVYIK